MKLLAGICGVVGMICLVGFILYANYMDKENDRRHGL